MIVSYLTSFLYVQKFCPLNNDFGKGLSNANDLPINTKVISYLFLFNCLNKK